MLPTSEAIQYGEELQRSLDIGSTAEFFDIIESLKGDADLPDALLASIVDWSAVAQMYGESYAAEAKASLNLGGYIPNFSKDWIPQNWVHEVVRQGLNVERSEPFDMIDVGKIVATLSRRVLASFRATVSDFAVSDSTTVGFARKTNPGCCAFCALVSTRIYSSREAAGVVVGERQKMTVATSSGRARRVKSGPYAGRARGRQGIGDKYHDHCKCTVVPVFEGSSDIVGEMSAMNGTSAIEAYYAARGDTNGSTKDVLAHMRKTLGAS